MPPYHSTRPRVTRCSVAPTPIVRSGSPGSQGGRAVIQAGVRGVEVLQALAAKDRTAVLGGCATVGIVGFLLGGGHNDITSNNSISMKPAVWVVALLSRFCILIHAC